MAQPLFFPGGNVTTLQADIGGVVNLPGNLEGHDVKERQTLITGGAGFIGSHLCERLLASGYDVLCVDNFYTGTRRNVHHLLGNARFELMRHDVCFPLYVEVDQIYNLACPASPIHYQFDPVQTTKTSVHGAINMLGLAKRVKATILQASTSEVYGDPAVHPQTEEYWGNVNPIGPRSCYDEGKRCAETLFFRLSTGSIACTSKWLASSILTAHACIQTMDASSLIYCPSAAEQRYHRLWRRPPERRSSATLMIWSMA